MLYLLYTADLSVILGSTIATYANGTAILAVHNNYIEASLRLQKSLYYI